MTKFRQIVCHFWFFVHKKATNVVFQKKFEKHQSEPFLRLQVEGIGLKTFLTRSELGGAAQSFPPEIWVKMSHF